MSPVHPAVHRAPLRSRDDTVDHAAAVEHALRRGVVGLGGRLDVAPADLDEAIGRVEQQHGERVAARLERFAALPVGDFVWTRDDDADLWLGRIEGEWRFDEAPAAAAADLQHVRSCRWSDAPVPWSDVPAAVPATFARGGRNFQRIHDAEAEAATSRWWAEHGSR
ncbi:hypothetical protein ASF35_08750 [Aeromicrobium sp. Leaf291]|nr:hypothetical protein ASF35_08750 [Aeromicrobium sp. Leaf291]